MEEFITCELQNNLLIPYAFPITGDDPTPAEHQAMGKYHEIMFAAYQGSEPFQGALVIRITSASGKPEAYVKIQEFINREEE